jgi:hypothetical protein
VNQTSFAVEDGALKAKLASEWAVLEAKTQAGYANVEQDQYICPQGEILPLWVRRKSEQVYVYPANKDVCNVCPVKSECTASKSGRHIFRSFFQKYLDKAKSYRQMESFQNTIRKRGVWVEPLFGEAEQFHKLRRFRLRGLWKANIEGVITATSQNLKRPIKYLVEGEELLPQT